jgi:hypothetical protein
MFAESTPQEWLKKAKDFMKLDLYELAAKCYRQGKEPYLQHSANILLHVQEVQLPNTALLLREIPPSS